MGETGAFAAATALRPADGVDVGGSGAFAADIPEGWDILGNVDGGLLLALAGRALTVATGRPDPVTVTGHFLSPGRPGAVEVHTELIKSGKRFATARATLLASGRPVLTALGTTGTLGPADEVLHVDGEPPDLPEPEDCELLVGGDGFPPAFTDRVDVRLHPEDTGFMRGEPSGTPGSAAGSGCSTTSRSTPSGCCSPSTRSRRRSSTRRSPRRGHRPSSSPPTSGRVRCPAGWPVTSGPGS